MSDNQPRLPEPRQMPTSHKDSTTRQHDYLAAKQKHAVEAGIELDKICERCEWYFRFVHFNNEAWLKDDWQFISCTCKPAPPVKYSDHIIYEEDV